jgi:S1-C subfamily serine protease
LAEALTREQLVTGEPQPLQLLKLAMRIGIVPDLSEVRMGGLPKVLVLPGSLAEKAGIRSGDRITALDGRAVERIEDVLAGWGQLKLDDGLGLTLLREGKQIEVDLAGDLPRVLKRVGLVPDLSELGQNQPPSVQVLPGSPAEKAGIRSGDRITSLNGRTVKRSEDVLLLWGQLKLDHGLTLTLLREGKQVVVTVPTSLLKDLLDSPDQDTP